MVYLSHITNAEKPDFYLQIMVDAENTFADFHAAIQRACGYNADETASFFFLTESSPARHVEISQIDTGFSGSPPYIMGKTRLQDLFRSEQVRLIYVFDFFQDRFFDIELTQITMKKNFSEPLITSTRGDAPAQTLEEEDLHQNDADSFPIVGQRYDYGDLDDYTEIFGEMEDLLEGN